MQDWNNVVYLGERYKVVGVRYKWGHRQVFLQHSTDTSRQVKWIGWHVVSPPPKMYDPPVKKN